MIDIEIMPFQKTTARSCDLAAVLGDFKLFFTTLWLAR